MSGLWTLVASIYHLERIGLCVKHEYCILKRVSDIFNSYGIWLFLCVSKYR